MSKSTKKIITFTTYLLLLLSKTHQLTLFDIKTFTIPQSTLTIDIASKNSPSGNYIFAIGTSNPEIQIFKLAADKKLFLRKIPLPSVPVGIKSFISTNYFAVSCFDFKIRRVDFTTGIIDKVTPTAGEQLGYFDIFQNSGIAVVGSMDTTKIFRFNIVTQASLGSFNIPVSNNFRILILEQTQNYIVIGSWDIFGVSIYDYSTGAIFKTFEFRDKAIDQVTCFGIGVDKATGFLIASNPNGFLEAFDWKNDASLSPAKYIHQVPGVKLGKERILRAIEGSNTENLILFASDSTQLRILDPTTSLVTQTYDFTDIDFTTYTMTLTDDDAYVMVSGLNSPIGAYSKCDFSSQVLVNGVCYPCGTIPEFQTNKLQCQSYESSRYFTWTGEEDLLKNLTARIVIEEYNFDLDPVENDIFNTFKIDSLDEIDNTLVENLVFSVVSIQKDILLNKLIIEVEFNFNHKRIKISNKLNRFTPASAELPYINIFGSEIMLSIGINDHKPLNENNNNSTNNNNNNNNGGKNSTTKDQMEKVEITEDYKRIDNPLNRMIILIAIIIILLPSLASAIVPSCLNISTGFLKLFQIIELIGKFFFIPIFYRKTMNDFLYGINKLGDLINLDSLTFLEIFEEKETKYWRKITLYNQEKSILKSMPITFSLFLLIMTFKFFIYIIKKCLCGQKKNDKIKGNNEIESENKGKLERISTFSLSVLFEENLVDITFTSFYCLIGDTRLGNSTLYIKILNKAIAGFIMIAVLWKYLKLAYYSYNCYDRLCKIEMEILVDGMNLKSIKESKWVRLVNPLFKLKLITMMFLVVSLQIWKEACLISLIIIQLIYVVYLIFSSCKSKYNLFDGVMSRISVFLFETVVILILVASCYFYFEEHEILDPNELDKPKQMDNLLQIFLIGAVISSISLETIRVISSIISKIKKRKNIGKIIDLKLPAPPIELEEIEVRRVVENSQKKIGRGEDDELKFKPISRNRPKIPYNLSSRRVLRKGSNYKRVGIISELRRLGMRDKPFSGLGKKEMMENKKNMIENVKDSYYLREKSGFSQLRKNIYNIRKKKIEMLKQKKEVP